MLQCQHALQESFGYVRALPLLETHRPSGGNLAHEVWIFSATLAISSPPRITGEVHNRPPAIETLRYANVIQRAKLTSHHVCSFAYQRSVERGGH
jgi:hypothetical protein